VLERLKGLLLGGPKNLFDPRTFHHISLIAFFAWVGLGSDGLSSSAYGPEEAFLALRDHRHLAVFLAIATAATVFLIASSYNQIIEMFPSGGGGYVVATKLLGTGPGLVAGSALVVDYILTISISVAAGMDAIFSFIPLEWHFTKLLCTAGAVALLTTLNSRGVKESVLVLTPIFVAFVVTHAVLLGVGIGSHFGDLGRLAAETAADTRSATAELGLFGVLIVFMRAYTLGGGTYTGIEAVSNGIQILREPRVETGKRTNTYMAISLAVTAGGILFCYLLNHVEKEAGKTLNASLFEIIAGHWRMGDLPLGQWLVFLSLLAEGALLFVAAQTGFVAGPRTLATMAVDLWFPKRFAHLSERLVTQNGVVTMGIAALLVIFYTGGVVHILVVMYSVNVFVTFALSLLGMSLHWWRQRRLLQHWRRRLILAGVGTVVSGLILTGMIGLKFFQGAWVTIIITSMLIGFCYLVRAHYLRVRRLLGELDEVLTNLPLPPLKAQPQLAPEGPTAIVLVESYRGLGIHTLLSIQRLFPNHFRNFVFVSVGLVDSGQFKGVADVTQLEAQVRGDLEKYVHLANRMGFYAEYRYTLGTDLIAELEDICLDLVREFRRCVVFAGQLVFQRENLFTRSLHHETSFSIQRRLQFAGIQVVILPIRVWERQGRKAA
jgi:amino acid transporter